MQQHIELSLSGELTEGEELLWSGSPNSLNKNIVSPARTTLIIGIVIGILAIILIAIGIYVQIVVTDLSVSTTISIQMYFYGGFLAFITILILTIFFGQHAAMHNTHNTLYAITNRRVIIIRAGHHNHTTIDSFGNGDIGQIRRQEHPDGSGDLIFACRISLVQYTGNNSAHQASNVNGIFTRIDNVLRVEHLLISTLK